MCRILLDLRFAQVPFQRIVVITFFAVVGLVLLRRWLNRKMPPPPPLPFSCRRHQSSTIYFFYSYYRATICSNLHSLHWTTIAATIQVCLQTNQEKHNRYIYMFLFLPRKHSFTRFKQTNLLADIRWLPHGSGSRANPSNPSESESWQNSTQV